jgi:hypothetical protein
VTFQVPVYVLRDGGDEKDSPAVLTRDDVVSFHTNR